MNKKFRTKKEARQFLDYLNKHKKPVTRRDFISMGLMAAGQAILAPTLVSLLTKQAMAEVIGAAPISFPGAIVFDLVGGPGLTGNFLVGRDGPHALLDKYDVMGWNPRRDGIDERFGLPMPKANISKIMQGMTAVMSAGAQERFRLGSIIHQSQDDSDVNQQNIASLICEAGLKTEFLNRPAGLRQTASGGNSRPLADNPNYRSIFVGELQDLLNTMSLPVTLSDLSLENRAKLIETASALSAIQMKESLGGSQTKWASFITNQFSKAKENAVRTVNFDPRTDAHAQALYAITPASGVRDQAVLRAAITYNAVLQNTGPGVLSIGDCDYHDRGLENTEAKDLEIGTELGRSIELAHRHQKPLFIQVITDGGNQTASGTRLWNSDTPQRTMSLIGYYHPEGALKYRTNKSMQIGNYANTQTVDKETLVGASAVFGGQAAFANYLNVIGRVDEFYKYSPGFFANQVNDVLVFENQSAKL